MKRNHSFLFLLLMILVSPCFLTIGCWFFKNPSGPSPINLTSYSGIAVGTAKSVSFRVVLPPTQSETNATNTMNIAPQTPNAVAGIRAQTETSTPVVTFKITLLNIGNSANPTFTMIKKANVDASGTAQATFQSVPATSIIADIHIEGGSIGFYRDFHGASDLLSGADNIVDIAPKNSRLVPDILAGAVNQIIASPTAFLKVKTGLVAKILGGLQNLAPYSIDPYSEAVSIYLGVLSFMPTFTENQTEFNVDAGPIASQNSLKMSSVIGETTVTNCAGVVAIPTEDSAPMVIISDSSNNPMLLGFGGAGVVGNLRKRASVMASVVNSTNLDARSTARGLLVICPLLLAYDRPTRAAIIAEAVTKIEFEELVSLISVALANGQTDYLIEGRNSAIYQKALAALSSSIALRQSLLRKNRLRNNLSVGAPTLTENGDSTITFKNDTFVYYTAESSPAVFKYQFAPGDLTYSKIAILPGHKAVYDFSIEIFDPWASYFGISPAVDSTLTVFDVPSEITVSKSNILNSLKLLALVCDLIEARQLASLLLLNQNDLEIYLAILPRLVTITNLASEIFVAPSLVDGFKAFIQGVFETELDKIIEVFTIIAKKKITDWGMAKLNVTYFQSLGKILGAWSVIIKSYQFVNEGLPFLIDWKNAPDSYQQAINQSIPQAAISVIQVSPTPVIGRNSTQTLILTGTGFETGMTVNVAWTDKPEGKELSSDQVRVISQTEAHIKIVTQTDADTWSVKVKSLAGEWSTPTTFQVSEPMIPVTDGFVFPFGEKKPYTEANDGDGWKNDTPFGEPKLLKDGSIGYHLGGDWNADSGTSTDLGSPTYAAANGAVVFSGIPNVGNWGKILILRHRLTDGSLRETLYGHLKDILVDKNTVTKGEPIGTIGDGDGLYPNEAHLHFEVRTQDCPDWGYSGTGYSVASKPTGWLDPTDFLNANQSSGQNILVTGISVAPTAITVNVNGTYDLADIITTAFYSDGSSKVTSDVAWSIREGNGTIDGTIYSAPSAAGKDLLTCTYAENVVTNLTVTITLPAPESDYTSGNIGILKYVPAGTFQRDDTSSNTSYVSAFRMSQNEITRAQFLAIMETDPSYTEYSSGISAPVQNVNWYHAVAFCNKLSIAEGLTPVYTVSGVNFNTQTFDSIPTDWNDDWNLITCNWSANGYRLPTEMEWMWAAMGANQDSMPGAMVGGINVTGYTKYFAGSNGSNVVGDYAWYNTPEGSKAVGTKLANELGLYDMSGNVWEWCWDRYASYPSGALSNYRGADDGSWRVVHGGGCYNFYAADITISGRINSIYLWFRHYALGFRVVRP